MSVGNFDFFKTVNLSAGNVPAFRDILEALPIPIHTTDGAGRLTWFNPAALAFYGSPAELGTDPWLEQWSISPYSRSDEKSLWSISGSAAPKRIFQLQQADLRDAQGLLRGHVYAALAVETPIPAEHAQVSGVLEAAPECVATIAADGSLLSINRCGLDLLGASSFEEIVGHSLYRFLASECHDRYRRFTERICAGKNDSLEVDILTLNGDHRHIEIHAAPLNQTDGAVIQVAVLRPLTEPKRRDNAARLLSAIVDSSDDAIISKDLSGRITSWNDSAQRTFGYSADEAVGRNVADLLIPHDRQHEEPQILARLRDGQRIDHFETKRLRKDGVLIDVSLTVSPVKDTDGLVVGASKIARDISESKRIENALIASESNLRQLADAMPQIVWTATADGKVDYLNERWYEFTGFDRTAPTDLDWRNILHPADLQPCLETWTACIETGRPYNIEYRFYDRHNRQWRWFMGRAIAVYSQTGKIVKWFGSCTDIDEQKRVQEDLRRTNQALEQFAFSASHDLQEPLRTVKIYTELLLKRHSDSIAAEPRKFLSFIYDAASRMELLVRDLLEYSQAARLEEVVEVTDANEALRSVVADLAAAVSENSAEVTSDPLPSIRVHKLHLKQLLQNLISNAVKYRSPDRAPLIHVSAEPENDRWVFSVRDNGIGIDPQYKEHIFGLFRRLHSDSEYSGTGLGLAICQRVVDRYHGRIWVESEVGNGATFRFTLPA